MNAAIVLRGIILILAFQERPAEIARLEQFLPMDDH